MRLLGGGRLAELFEANRRLDVGAQDRLAGVDIAGEHGVDPFAQQRGAEGGIACDPLLHQLLEIPCHWHRPSPFTVPAAFAAACSPPTILSPARCRAAGVAWCRP